MTTTIKLRSFGGIISNNINDYYPEEVKDDITSSSVLSSIGNKPDIKADYEVAKTNRSFHQKMLKAYLRGDQYFNFGYIGRDRYGNLVPNRFAVLTNSEVSPTEVTV